MGNIMANCFVLFQFNLVTERARNLRAMYALQTKDLHCRIERRVNRIPVALRKMEMQELVARHEETKK